MTTPNVEKESKGAHANNNRTTVLVSSMKHIFALAFFFLAAVTANAQEEDCSGNCSSTYCAPDTRPLGTKIERGCECFDTLDNDGDGVADKKDPNCASFYGLTYVNTEGAPDCSLPTSDEAAFVGLKFATGSSQNTADTHSKVVVGDVDGDGSPDVVITGKFARKLTVAATWGTNAAPQADGSKAGESKGTVDATSVSWFDHGTGSCDPQGTKPTFEHEIAIADIDRTATDKRAEIFAIVGLRPNAANNPVPQCYYLVGMRYNKGNGNIALLPGWGGKATLVGSDRPGAHGIADMDGDGKAEVYFRDRIYAAETGKLLAYGNGNWDSNTSSGPVAADILTGDGGRMELIVGTKIFQIPAGTLSSNRSPATATLLTVTRDMNTGLAVADQAFVKLAEDPTEYGIDTHSMTSVADLDRDGTIDVVISGALGSNTGPTTVFYWNVAKNRVTRYNVPDAAYANGWPWGTGRVNIGDVDGDGSPNLSFIAGATLFCVNIDEASGALTTRWTRAINDSKSGVCTVTVYDFDSDQNPELVYRDAQELVIVDGNTGATKIWSTTCQSHTYTEGPIVADVNDDGLTDICVTCNTNNSFDIDADLQQQALGQVRLYYNENGTWTPARKVWNQQPYFVVNINDDMTLPFPQVDQNLEFPGGSCTSNVIGAVMKLNVFLNQIPFLTSSGCPVTPAPDLAITDILGPDGVTVLTPRVEVDSINCGENVITAHFNIQNIGDLPITDNVKVSFFNGDPRLPGAVRLHNTTINIVNLGLDQFLTPRPTVQFVGPGTAFTLWVVLNNDGSVLPLASTGSAENECTIANNFESFNIVPKKLLAVPAFTNNFTCGVPPNTGTASVKLYKDTDFNGTYETEMTDYSGWSFQWYLGPSTGYSAFNLVDENGNPIPSTNPTLQKLPAGQYTIVARNTIAEPACDTNPVDVTIIDENLDPDFDVAVSNNTKCTPFDGSITATITSPGGSAGINYYWFDIGNAVELPFNSPSLSGLAPNSYLLIAYRGPIDPANECKKDTTVSVLDFARPTVLADKTDLLSCLDADPKGEIRATAIVDGIPLGSPDPVRYDFRWYNAATFNPGPPASGTFGSILADNNLDNPTLAVPPGQYGIELTDTQTNCTARDFIEVLDARAVLTVSIDTVRANRSCDPANHNGELRAVVSYGNVSDYRFQWFAAQNTLGTPVKDAVGAAGATLTGARGAGQMYTVKAILEATQCFATAEAGVPDSLIYPIITTVKTDNNICDPTRATVTEFAGSVTVSIMYDGQNVAFPTSDFVFEWFDGTTTFGGGPVLDGLQSGNYTVSVRHATLQCPSNIEAEQILNLAQPTPVDPATVFVTGSRNCAGIAPAGQVGVFDLNANDAAFDYVWRRDSDNVVVSDPAKPWQSTANLQGGIGSWYTLYILESATGCENTVQRNVPDLHVIPEIDPQTVDNAICDPDLTSPRVEYTGEVDTNITNLQPGETDATYQYFWTDLGTGATALENRTQLPTGLYTVRVRNTVTGCESVPATRQITNTWVLPDIDAIGIASTNCDPDLANGSVKLNSVDGVVIPAAGPTAPWDVKWFDTDDASKTFPEDIGEMNSLQGAPGEFYTVQVTDERNGCRDIRIVEVPDRQRVPRITLTSDPNTNCDVDDPNGVAYIATLEFDIDGDGVREVIAPTTLVPLTFAGYTPRWYAGQTVVDPSIGAAFELPDRPMGYYTLEVTKDDVGCTSDPDNVFVDELLVYPVIAETIAAQRSCDEVTDVNGDGVPDNRTGQIDIALVAGHTYEWFLGGAGFDTPVPAGNINPLGANSAYKLDGNEFYTVRVTNTSTKCQSDDVFFVPEFTAIPRIELAVTDIVDCTVPGNITATVFIDQNDDGDDTDPGDVVTDYSTFEFFWYTGTGVDMANRIAGETGNALANVVIAGNYTVQVVSEYSCTSSDLTDLLSGPGPLFSIGTNQNFYPASCADQDGVITAFVVDGGGNTITGYTFEWHEGSILNGIQTPPASFYTDPIVEFNEPPLPPDPNNWYNNAATKPDPNNAGQPLYPAGGDLSLGEAQIPGPTLYSVASGTYTVVVTRDADGCKEYLTTYLQYQDEPVIILAEVKPDECNADVGEITVDLLIPGGNTANQYILYLFEQPVPAFNPPATIPENIPAVRRIDNVMVSNNPFANLPSGIYTVVAQEKPSAIPTGCFSAPVQVELREALPPFLNLEGAGFNSTCGLDVTADGSLDISFETDPSDPFSPGFPTPPPPTSYIITPQSYTVTIDGPGITAPPQTIGSGFASGTQLTIPNLTNGEFQVTVTSIQNCAITKTFTVPWLPDVPAIDEAELDPDNSLYCDPAVEAAAKVQVLSVNGDPSILNDYNYRWYTDADTTNRVHIANGAAGALLQNGMNGVPAGTVTGYGISGGQPYYVVATKIAGTGAGCSSAATNARVFDDSVDPSADLVPFANTSCEDINGEGELTIEVLAAGSVASPTYTYDWDQATNPVDIEADIYSAPSTGVTGNNGNADGTDGDGDHTEALLDGLYTVNVINEASRCRTLRQATILRNEIPLVIVEATPTPQELCPGGGTITVNEVTLDGVPEAIDFSAYDFTWYKDNLVNVILNESQNAYILDRDNYPAIRQGQYYVKAKRRTGTPPGSGCESAPFPVVIGEDVVYPTVTFETIKNTACNDVFTGEIHLFPVTVRGPGSLPVVTYSFTWTYPTGKPVDNALEQTMYNPFVADTVAHTTGNEQYVVRITNDSTQCFIDQPITVGFDPLELLVEANKQDQDICFNDGSVFVTSASVNGVNSADIPGDFEFRWFRADPNTTALVDGGAPPATITADLIDVNNYPSIGAYPAPSETYYVYGIKREGLAAGCETNLVQQVIVDIAPRPVVVMTALANSSCKDPVGGNGGNGVITVTVTDGPGLFTYNWDASNPTSIETRAGVNPATGIPGNNGDGTNAGDLHAPFGDNPIDLLDGVYRAVVTNETSGCPTNAQTEIIRDLTISLPSIVQVIPRNPLQCLEDSDGELEITEIRIGGIVQDPANWATDFEFFWTKDIPYPDGTTINASPTDFLLSGLDAGTYYVSLIVTSTECQGGPVERTLTTDALQLPDVNISLTKLQLSCVEPGSAELRADPAEFGGAANTNGWEITWHSGLVPDATNRITTGGPGCTSECADPIGVTPPSFIRFVGVPDSDVPYSVQVKSLDTKCVTTDYFIVQDQKAKYSPTIVLNANGVTNCDLANGSLIVREITKYNADDPAEVDYYTTYPGGHGALGEQWEFTLVPDDNFGSEDPLYVPGADPATTNPYWEIDSLGLKTYTVTVLDKNTGCTVTESITIEDDTVLPVIAITSENPLTNCDPARANGRLAATADGGLIGGYTFDWYAGSIDPGEAPVIAGSSQLLGAFNPPGQYTVHVTNDFTGCEATLVGEVDNKQLPAPTPTPELIQHDTHCVVDDGWVWAYVDKDDPNDFGRYSFEWYDGTEVSGDVDNEQRDYMDLPEGTYTVRAIDRQTGCVSAPVSINVEEILVIPTMEFVTTPSFCSDVKELSGTGRGTGTIALTLSPADVVADLIEWTDADDGMHVGLGNYITDLLPGFYDAHVITSKGCEATDRAEVLTEIRSYNLVSQNNDGSNDSFFIDCISLFPNNNVKIFNRSGVLVYEADHYDNEERVFKGFGERGIYPGGNQLPVGTYFYIIDKGDGSKPRVGYLELVR